MSPSRPPAPAPSRLHCCRRRQVPEPAEGHLLRDVRRRLLVSHDAVPGRHSLLVRSTSGVRYWEESIKADAQAFCLYNEYQKLLEGAGAKYEMLKTGFKEGDCLLIVDMQNDFLPKDDAPDGGRFGVAEGASAAIIINAMTKKAAEANALIIATRDYHPRDHCSFLSNGGPFPPHCLQGSLGSALFPPVKEVLREVREQGAKVKTVFKGFHPSCDSFGGVRYGKQYFTERNLGNGKNTEPLQQLHGCCALEWTGSFALECANIEEDLDAPPDVLAVHSRQTLADMLKEAGVRRLFVCGLALDFCVLDSALNAATATGGSLAPEGVFLVVDGARAAHIPGIGTFGSGFLSDPQTIVKKTAAAGVSLIKSEDIWDSVIIGG